MKNHSILTAVERPAPSSFLFVFQSDTLCLAVALMMMLGAPAVSAAVTSTGDNYLQTSTWVGYFSNGSLTVDSGSTFTTSVFYVGSTATGIGTLTATGSGSTITANSKAFIGYSGPGVLNITSGAVFSANGASGVAESGAFGVGYSSAGNGTVNVSGTGSALTLSDILFLGHSGTGTINLSSGATMTTNKTVYLGASTGKGTLNISSGAVLTSNGTSAFPNPSIISIGNTAAGASSATVDGAGSQWIIPDTGIGVSGGLTVSNGGKVSTNSVGVSSTGKLLITGAAATLDLKNSFAIDNPSSSAAIISAGGILNARANSHVGSQNTQGAMTVTGAGSQVNVVGNMLIGDSSGRGTLTVADGALFSVSKTGSALGTGDGILTVGGQASDSNPGTPIGVAVLYIGTGGAAGKLNVAEVYGYASTNPPVPPTDSTVVFNHNETTYQFTNTAGNGILINGGTKVRQEAGTTIFSAASGYQGGTLITGGRLVVNNASGSGTGSGAVNVSGTGVLGGRGTISGNITVASGGATLPGDSQILKVGSLKYQAGSAAKFTLATTGAGGEVPAAGMNYDRIQMTGNLVIDSGATLQLHLTASSLSYFHDHNGTDPLGNYFLFDLTAPITGKFDFLSLMLDGTTYTQAISGGRATFTEFDLAFDVGYTGNAATNSLTGGSAMTVHAVSSVPEPMAGLLLALGFGAAMLKRRR